MNERRNKKEGIQNQRYKRKKACQAGFPESQVYSALSFPADALLCQEGWGVLECGGSQCLGHYFALTLVSTVTWKTVRRWHWRKFVNGMLLKFLPLKTTVYWIMTACKNSSFQLDKHAIPCKRIMIGLFRCECIYSSEFYDVEITPDH